MVGYRPARGLYTLLTDPNLVGHNLLGILCKGLCSVPMQPHLGMVPAQHRMVGFKVIRSFYAACGESVQPLQSAKLIN
jgi:hypothetical protein